MSDLHPKIKIPSTPPQKICIVPLPTVPNLPAIINAHDICDNNSMAQPEEIVAGLIHTTTKVVLAGPSKAGKTWMLLYLALCINSGANFLNHPTKKGRVLYINFEIQEGFMKSRVNMLMKHMGITSAHNLDIWNLRGFAGDFEALWAEILRGVIGKGYTMIIIDPIYKLMNGKSENGAAGVAILCSRLEQLVEESGAAVVYVHHFAKGDSKKKSPIDRMSGSGVFARDADTIITLTEHSEENCYTLETTLRNFPRQNPVVVEWQFPVLVVRDDLDAEDITVEEAPTDTDEGLIELLREKPLTTAEWQAKVEELGKSRATFYRIKAVLKEKGFVEFDGKTKTWRVPASESKSQQSQGSHADTSDTGETGKVAQQEAATPQEPVPEEGAEN